MLIPPVLVPYGSIILAAMILLLFVFLASIGGACKGILMHFTNGELDKIPSSGARLVLKVSIYGFFGSIFGVILMLFALAIITAMTT